MKLIIRWLISAAALWVAAELVNGIDLTGSFLGILFVTLVFGLINAIIGTILKILGLPFILLTLGLFILVINAFLLWLTAAILPSFSISGFGPALLGALIVSLVSWLLNAFLKDED